MLHLVVKAALKDARTSLAEFVASLEDTENTPNSIAIAQKMLGRELTAEDLNADDVVSLYPNASKYFMAEKWVMLASVHTGKFDRLARRTSQDRRGPPYSRLTRGTNSLFFLG